VTLYSTGGFRCFSGERLWFATAVVGGGSGLTSLGDAQTKFAAHKPTMTQSPRCTT
jgi:hypothetical protein